MVALHNAFTTQQLGIYSGPISSNTALLNSKVQLAALSGQSPEGSAAYQTFTTGSVIIIFQMTMYCLTNTYTHPRLTASVPGHLGNGNHSGF